MTSDFLYATSDHRKGNAIGDITLTIKSVHKNVSQRCSYTTYKKIDALGHIEIVDKAVAPTCTETGLTEGVNTARYVKKFW